MKRTLAMIGVVTLLANMGCSTFQLGRYKLRLRTTWHSKPAPDFELAALDGGSIKLGDLRGKPVLLAFWAHG